MFFTGGSLLSPRVRHLAGVSRLLRGLPQGPAASARVRRGQDGGLRRARYLGGDQVAGVLQHQGRKVRRVRAGHRRSERRLSHPHQGADHQVGAESSGAAPGGAARRRGPLRDDSTRRHVQPHQHADQRGQDPSGKLPWIGGSRLSGGPARHS
ncbi:unnamed protein product, partial [Ectocarpus fasciculatus]